MKKVSKTNETGTTQQQALPFPVRMPVLSQNGGARSGCALPAMRFTSDLRIAGQFRIRGEWSDARIVAVRGFAMQDCGTC